MFVHINHLKEIHYYVKWMQGHNFIAPCPFHQTQNFLHSYMHINANICSCMFSCIYNYKILVSYMPESYNFALFKLYFFSIFDGKTWQILFLEICRRQKKKIKGTLASAMYVGISVFIIWGIAARVVLKWSKTQPSIFFFRWNEKINVWMQF